MLIWLVACTETEKSNAKTFQLQWSLDSVDLTADKSYATFTIEGALSHGEGAEWTLYYNQLAGTPSAMISEQATFEHITGDYFKLIPGELITGDNSERAVRIPVVYNGIIDRISDMPKGPYFADADGAVYETDYKASGVNSQTLGALRLPDPGRRFIENTTISKLNKNELSWIPSPEVFVSNDGVLQLAKSASIWSEEELSNERDQLINRLREVFSGSFATASSREHADIALRLDPSQGGEESYHLVVSGGGIEITGGGKPGVFYAVQSLMRLIDHQYYNSPGDEIAIQYAEVRDQPRFQYRGVHFDVSRNFHPKEDVKRLIDQLAFYKLNVLHLTLTNDEGWRIEIPGLEELTEVGSLRGHTTTEADRLFPAYGSGPIADPDYSRGSGYYSREDFIEILEYARDRYIEIIPEIDIPGHARAAIVAMRARYEKYAAAGEMEKAEEFLLHDANDTSRYVSAQNYSDNVICVCMDSPYAFIDKVLAEMVDMYEEAGCSLNTLHCGGDELPHGSWFGSPICQQFIAETEGLKDASELHALFLVRLLEITGRYGIKLAGWEEVTLESDEKGHNTTAINYDLVGSQLVPYVWNSVWGWGREDMAYRLANLGYPLVMCNSMALYFDMAYNRDPLEPGLTWSGTVDTRDVFAFEPLDMFSMAETDVEGNRLDPDYVAARERLKPGAEANILGIQGQIWCETINTRDRLDYMVFPKLLALSERAWSRQPQWVDAGEVARQEVFDAAWNNFVNRVGQVEMPILDQMFEGVNYRIPLPGVMLEGNEIVTNNRFPGIEVSWSQDGDNITAVASNQAGRTGRTVVLRK